MPKHFIHHAVSLAQTNPAVSPRTRYGRLYYAWRYSPKAWKRSIAIWIAEWFAPRREALKYGLSANGTERFKQDHQGLPNAAALFKRIEEEKWFSPMYAALKHKRPS